MTGIPDFIGSSDVVTQSYDPSEAGRALLDALLEAKEDGTAVSDALACWVHPKYAWMELGLTAEQRHYWPRAAALYDALQALAIATGWRPPT